MKVILFYDIASKNSSKIRKTCTKYLRHIQFSVFEGELEKPILIKLTNELLKLIDVKKDGIIIFSFTSFNEENKIILGINKNEFDGYNI